MAKPVIQRAADHGRESENEEYGMFDKGPIENEVKSILIFLKRNLFRKKYFVNGLTILLYSCTQTQVG